MSEALRSDNRRPDGEAPPVIEVLHLPQSAAGQPAALRLRVHHDAPAPRSVTLCVIGLDSAWVPGPARVLDLPPMTAASVELILHPAAGAVAARYPFVVTAQCTDPGSGASTAPAAVAESVLTVGQPGSVTVSIDPAEVRTSRGRRVRIVLANSGAAPVRTGIEVTSPPGMRASCRTTSVEVPPHGTRTVKARVRGRRIRMLGHPVRHTYSVSTHGAQAPATARGVLAVRPVFGPGWRKVLALATVVAVWAAAAVIGIPWASERLSRGEDQSAVADGGHFGDAVSGDGSPGGSGGAARSGDPGGEEGGTDAQVIGDGTRISGVVEAEQPGGVTVALAPTSSFGEAGADAKVALAGDEPTADSTVDLHRSTVTNEDGAWAVAGLGRSGYFLVTLSKAGFRTERRVVDVAAMTEPLTVRLDPGDGRVSGRVTGPDGPVGGAEVTITDGTLTVTTSSSTTGDVGTWAVDGLSTPSTYLVTAEAAGLGAASALVALEADGSASQNLELRQGTATMTGQITGRDTTGRIGGLGGVTVTADDGVTTRTATTVTTATGSGPRGLFTLPDLPSPGSYVVTVRGDGYEEQTRRVEFHQDGTALRQLDMRLTSSGGSVQGRVTTADGEPLGAGLSLVDDDGVAYKVMSAAGAGDGRYRFSGIAAGDYIVAAEVFGHLTGYARVEVSAGEVTTSDLALTPIPGGGLSATSSITGRVVDASTGGGEIVCAGQHDDCLVTVTTAAADDEGRLREVSAQFEPDATYTIPGPDDDGLLPGLYELVFSAPGFEPERLTVEVPMDQRVTAPVAALLPSPSIVGSVSTRVGSVPDGTCVVAVPAGAGPDSVGDCVPTDDDPVAPRCEITDGVWCAFTGPNGGYEIPSLPSGSYRVSVRAGDSEYRSIAPVTIALPAGDVRRYDATLNRLGRMRITVQGNDGQSASQPVAGATVRVTAGDEDMTDQVRIDRSDEADGVYLVTHLDPGVVYRVGFGWSIPGSDPLRTLSGDVESTAGLNNEVPLALTLTGETRRFTGQVVHELDGDDPRGVAGAKVEITGIVGYNGLLPVQDTASVVTDADGLFAVVPEPADGDIPEAVLPIVDGRVDIVVTKAGHERRRLSGVTVSDEQDLLVYLTPSGRPVKGRLALVPEADTDLSATTVALTNTPPGAEGTRIRFTSAGCLIWSDPGQRVDSDYTNDCGQDAGGVRASLARPGEYTARLSRPGYADAEVSFAVDLLTEGGRQELTGLVLSRDGGLAVQTVNADGEPVYGSRLVLSATGVPEQTRAAEPGTNRTVFNDLPSRLPDGGWYTIRVEAAGYEFGEFSAGHLVEGGVVAPEPSPFSVPPDGIGAYQVELVKMGEITGVLTAQTDVDGEIQSTPLAGATVRAEHESGLEFSASSGGGGRFSITGTRDVAGLVPGRWELTVDPPDGFTFEGEPVEVHVTDDYQVEYPAGNSDPFVLAVQAKPVEVFVNVYVPGADGEPPTLLAGMTVELLRGGQVQPAQPCGGDSCPDGEYRFVDVPPIPQTLRVSGENYAPLTLTIRPEPGEANTFNVPVTQLRNTIQGTIGAQAGSHPAEPLAEVDTWLCRADETDAEGLCPAEDGDPVRSGSVFEFSGLNDGTYVVDIRPRHGQPYPATTRTVTVAAGQIVAFDIVLHAAAEPITVTAIAENGWDLTGAVVRLVATDGSGQSPPAAQTVVRAGEDEYSTTFAQVPAGTWEAILTGPQGHVGVHTSGPPGETTRDLVIDVAEVRIRMDVRSAAVDSPGTVSVSVADSQSQEVLADQLLVNAGLSTVYLKNDDEYTVDVDLPEDAPSGWSVEPSRVDVPSGERDVAARFVLEPPPPTTTAVTVSPDPAVAGEPVTFTASVSSAGGAVDGGEVEFSVDGESVGNAEVEDGSADFAHTFPAGGTEHSVRAVYSGPGYADSEATTTVSVESPPDDEDPPADDEDPPPDEEDPPPDDDEENPLPDGQGGWSDAEDARPGGSRPAQSVKMTAMLAAARRTMPITSSTSHHLGARTTGTGTWSGVGGGGGGAAAGSGRMTMSLPQRQHTTARGGFGSAQCGHGAEAMLSAPTVPGSLLRASSACRSPDTTVLDTAQKSG
ncbi:hypothetical protein G1H11_00195 [Phytoactinopolyspora alkaliphila]|uniref:alpha-amylase n=1 Tax=Phytoactinopolyspora alkaliphila TaxID=1783498 RepID=A0A6N9YFJ3_9ACTN|nr:carboxypeptidase regulatory-like domain-containing protein [Phytoactinopolyspora alkaliphila]NED93732.1 hypothetical protein [Phytoactinopolyspora alkaliphila]